MFSLIIVLILAFFAALGLFLIMLSYKMFTASPSYSEHLGRMSGDARAVRSGRGVVVSGDEQASQARGLARITINGQRVWVPQRRLADEAIDALYDR
jgi:hypothetical protein